MLDSYYNLVRAALDRGEIEKARKYGEALLSETTRLYSDKPDNWRAIDSILVRAQIEFADGKFDIAATFAEQSAARFASILEKNTSNADVRNGLLQSEILKGDIYTRLSSSDRAVDAYMRALALLAHGDDDDTRSGFIRATILRRLGSLDMSNDRLAAADRRFSEAHDILRRLVERDPHRIAWRIDLAMLLLDRAEFHRLMKDDARSCHDLRDGLSALQRYRSQTDVPIRATRAVRALEGALAKAERCLPEPGGR